MMRKSYRRVGCLMISGLCGTGALSAADLCETLGDANGKVVLMPAHVYVTETAAATKSQPRNSETIFTGGANGAVYVMANGKWHKSALTPSEMKAAIDEGKKEGEAKASCRYLRDEPVDGETAEVYAVHSENPDFKIDTTIWISKSRKLPLKSERDMDVGGAAGRSHAATRYDYVNVKPPAGVQ